MFVEFNADGDVLTLHHGLTEPPEGGIFIELADSITDSRRIKAIRNKAREIIGVEVLPPIPDPYEYRALRAVEYAQRIPLGDQLDAILKHLEPQVLPGTDLERVVENWRQIKAKYPKPVV